MYVSSLLNKIRDQTTDVSVKYCHDLGGAPLLIFAAPFLQNIPRVEVIKARAQDVDEALIDTSLQDGDMLFIDSTHTVKHNSDCLHIYLRILPYIRNNIFVHAHDIYLPGPLPIHTMRDHQVYWNEQYILYAYMIDNPRTKVLYSSAYHHQANLDLLAAFMHNRFTPGGGSLWFFQSGPANC